MKKVMGTENIKWAIGDSFDLCDFRWTILDITKKGYMCLAESLDEDMQFGSNNDWKEGRIRKYLNGEFAEKIATEIGEGNLIEFERNLLSLDGQAEYGSCLDKVSLLNVDEYRKYRKHIPNTGYWWWLITADSTQCNNDYRWITVVSPSGNISNDICNSGNGVRPFCIFSSMIFESEDE